jgi:hypothetical protein
MPCKPRSLRFTPDDDQEGLPVPIVPLLASAAFDDEATRLLCAAFEAAWQAVKTSGSALADETRATSTRERLAYRVIEMGRRGERNHDRLVEDALAHLARSTAAPDVTPDGAIPLLDVASPARATPCR